MPFLDKKCLNQDTKNEVTEIGPKKPFTMGLPRRCCGNELPVYQGIATRPVTIRTISFVLGGNELPVYQGIATWFVAALYSQ